MNKRQKYIRMCQEAKEVQKEWMKMPKEKRYGTLIRYRTFLGIVVPTDRPLEFEGLSAVVPETLAFRTWLKEGETLIVTAVKLEPYDDRGTPLFRQDQLQDMIFPGIPAFLIQNTFCKWCRENLRYAEEFTFMGELWLAFIMKKKYNKIWDDEKSKWIEGDW
ncbi:MAG: hypothetical protein J7K87_04580 [Candidatus Aenigmarchaeota archaeon]|nr:hypothetical protein [Candidatus Aenigmarchaeota archaeon]